ncbi:hypothetical protein WMY93_034278, partial [Mugilogobius chulae]
RRNRSGTGLSEVCRGARKVLKGERRRPRGQTSGVRRRPVRDAQTGRSRGERRVEQGREREVEQRSERGGAKERHERERERKRDMSSVRRRPVRDVQDRVEAGEREVEQCLCGVLMMKLEVTSCSSVAPAALHQKTLFRLMHVCKSSSDSGGVGRGAAESSNTLTSLSLLLTLLEDTGSGALRQSGQSTVLISV